MEDASGKFALVMLRAKQVRVHHKRTKHEYVFRISDDRIEAASKPATRRSYMPRPVEQGN